MAASRLAVIAAAFFVVFTVVPQTQGEPDFTGRWTLGPERNVIQGREEPIAVAVFGTDFTIRKDVCLPIAGADALNRRFTSRLSLAAGGVCDRMAAMTFSTTTIAASLGLAALLTAGLAALQPSAQAQAKKPTAAIFDGKTLNGWHKPKSVPAEYRGGKWEVVDGTLVGDQDPPGMGGFLVTDKIYRDFVIEFDINLDEPADSGVFMRMGEDGKNHQLTLDNDHNKKFGDVYLSWGRGTVHEAPEGKKHFRQGEWNTVKIQIQGEPARIQFWLNGVAITDFQHTAETTSGVPKEGRIGLQIHDGADNSYGKVRYRNIRLTEL